jgi:hypothetical protein
MSQKLMETLSLFIEVAVPSQKIEQPCIRVLGVFSTIFQFEMF